MASSPASRPVVLVIAGSDSGAGAGIQADIKSCMANGAHATTVITAITAQNSMGVQGVWSVAADAVTAQFRSVMDDIGADAIKIGMLGTADMATLVADLIRPWADKIPVVLDPVCASKHGDALLADDALAVLREQVVPLATVVTPNAPEASLLTGIDVDSPETQSRAARMLVSSGARWALVKGGHIDGDAHDLLTDGQQDVPFSHRRVDTVHTHGTGCTLASAIAAHLAAGADVPDAVTAAKNYVTGAIENSYALGRGIGPLAHDWQRVNGR